MHCTQISEKRTYLYININGPSPLHHPARSRTRTHTHTLHQQFVQKKYHDWLLSEWVGTLYNLHFTWSSISLFSCCWKEARNSNLMAQAQTQSDEQELGGATAEIEISFKKKGAVSRNWIVLDSSGGEGMILDLDKFDIMSRVPINGRDLRILDPLLSYPSAILVRETAIVLNLEVTTSLFFLSFFFLLHFLLPFFFSVVDI